MRKPNQPLSPQEQNDLDYRVYTLGYKLISEFGWTESVAMDMAVNMVELQILNEQLEAMRRVLDVQAVV